MKYLACLILALSCSVSAQPTVEDDSDAVVTGMMLTIILRQCIAEVAMYSDVMTSNHCAAQGEYDAYIAARSKVREPSTSLRKIDKLVQTKLAELKELTDNVNK